MAAAQATKKNGLKSTITVAMSNYLEAGSIVAGAGGLTLWVEYLKLDDVKLGLLGALSANGFGSAIGALIGGVLVDKYGRKLIYKYDLLVYMLGVLLVALSFNFPMLLAGYVITGIAVGAAIPAAWTYISEEAPAGERAARVGWGQLAWSIGPAISLLLSVALAPLGLLGSRLIFGQLFVIALITWIMQQQISESKIWEEEKAREAKAKALAGGKAAKSSVAELFKSRANLRSIVLLLGIYCFWNLVAGVMGYFMPYIYQRVGGLTSAQANLLQAFLWILTVASTYFVFIKFGDKANRKVLYGIGAFMGIAAWAILSFGGMGMAELLAFVVLWGVAAGFGAQAFYGLWAGELFHTKYRAKAQGFLFSTARVAVGLISLVVPSMLTSMGFAASGMVMIGFLVIAAVIGVVMAPETRGKTLEQIQEEVYGRDFVSHPDESISRTG